MKMKFTLFLSIIVLSANIYHCDKTNTHHKSKYRFIYNNDGTEILGNRWHQFRPLTIEDVHSYVDVVANTGITTFMICSGSMLTYYNSKFERPLGLPKSGRAEDICNDAHLNENIPRYGRNYLRLQEQGTDIIELCVNRAREKGLESFISMRMNDLHFTDPDIHCPAAQSDIWLDHPEWRMGEHPGWHADGALNFKHEGVRRYRLNLIREQCEMYNIDGIELDFMRFIVYFPYKEGKSNLNLMTDFIREARKIVDISGREKGRPILLAVRVPAQFDLCMEKGLDVSQWARENLIDMITVSAHWIGDPALPIRDFKSKLYTDHIPVYASLESGQYYPREFRSHGIYRAAASHCLNQGADGIYLFNFFLSEYSENKYQPDRPLGEFLFTDVRNPLLLAELKDSESLTGRNKIYTLSDGTSEYGYEPNTPLPIQLYSWNQADIHLEVGDDFQASLPDSAYLFIRTRKAAKLRIHFNGIGTGDASESLIRHFGRNVNVADKDMIIVRTVPVNALLNGDNVITIRSYDPVPATIKRLELALQFGPVEENGYF